jgi:DNA polymerase
VRSAIANPGVTFDVRMLKIRRDGAWLRIKLPSGRYLCYLQPRVEEGDQITYMGVNQYTRRWGRIKTYGGKITENIVQAIARDVLAYNMDTIERAGYEIVLSVHDELLTETADTTGFSHEDLAELMSINPEWAQGLPLSAAGFETYRYRKD